MKLTSTTNGVITPFPRKSPRILRKDAAEARTMMAIGASPSRARSRAYAARAPSTLWVSRWSPAPWCVPVGAADARLRVGWADPPSPVLGRAEQSRETCIAVEAGPAQPVDVAIATDECGGRAIADQCIILDGERQVGAHGGNDAATRRRAVWSSLRVYSYRI